jgi:hypothetical protein
MGGPRFLIAKYIPDVFRNEPRNIGVVLWTPDGVAARFLGEKPDAPGVVDESAIPPFIASAVAYKQWVRYWRRELAKADGTPESLETIRQTGASNYLLADGGIVNPLSTPHLPTLLSQLFQQLVALDQQETFVASGERTVASAGPEPFSNDRASGTFRW